MDITDLDATSTSVEKPTPRIVVGVDGSPASITALRHARHHASLEGLAVQAVTCWDLPPMYNGFVMLNFDDFRQGAAEILEKAIDEAYGDDTPEDLRLSIVGGDAREALVSLGRNSRMLVLGTRGHGPFTGFFLGSISAGCIAHATCPVLIVHPDSEVPFTARGGSDD